MGAALLHERNVSSICRPISATPHEQNELQYLDRQALYDLVTTHIRSGVSADGTSVLIYCNSLSTAIDLGRLRSDIALPIVTPLEVYQRWAHTYSRLALISANSQAAAGIEAVMLAANPDLSMLSIGLLPVVEAIEKGIEPRKIIEDYRLAELIAWFGSQADQNLRPEAVVLGCTHFPYLSADLLTAIDIPALDPSAAMIDALLDSLAEIDSRQVEAPGSSRVPV